MTKASKASQHARTERMKPVLDYRVPGTDGYTHFQVFILHPGDVFEGFGGSRSGLLVGKTPSVVVRSSGAWGTNDLEMDTWDHKRWAQILKGYDNRIREPEAVTAE